MLIHSSEEAFAPSKIEPAMILPIDPIAGSKDNFGAGLFRSTLILTFSSILRVTIVFALQVVLATKFGAKLEMDSFLAATTLPTLIAAVLIEQLNMTLIPVLVEYKIKNGASEVWIVVSTFINLAFIVLAFLTLIGIIGGDWLVRLTTPGFSDTDEAFTLTTKLLRVIFPSIIFSGLAGLLNGVFYAQRRFTLPSLASILNALTTLLVTWGLATNLGIISVAVGTLAGSVVQFGVLFPVLLKEKRYHLQLRYRHPGVVKILRLARPLVLGAILYKASPAVDRFIASGLPEGSISYLGYAFRIVSILLFLVTQGIAVSFLPMMSERAAANDKEGLRKIVSLGTGVLTFIIAPLITGLAIFGEPAIQLFFERGAFNHQATTGATSAMLCYLGWLYAGAIGTIQTYALFSLQDTSTVVKVGVIGMLLEIALAVVLSRFMGFNGIALALSAVTAVNMVIFAVILHKRLRGMDGNQMFSSLVKVCFSCLFMAGTSMGVNYFLSKGMGTAEVHSAMWVVSLTAGLACYLALTWLLKCEEMMYLRRRVHRLRIRRMQIEPQIE